MITWLFMLSLLFQLPMSPGISRFGRQPGERPVNVPSSISGATFSQILQEAGSPLAEHASRIYAHCEAGGVD